MCLASEHDGMGHKRTSNDNSMMKLCGCCSMMLKTEQSFADSTECLHGFILFLDCVFYYDFDVMPA